MAVLGCFYSRALGCEGYASPGASCQRRSDSRTNTLTGWRFHASHGFLLAIISRSLTQFDI